MKAKTCVKENIYKPTANAGIKLTADYFISSLTDVTNETPVLLCSTQHV